MDSTAVFRGVLNGVKIGIATLLEDEEMDSKVRGNLRLTPLWMVIIEPVLRHVFDAGVAYGKGEPLPGASGPYIREPKP